MTRYTNIGISAIMKQKKYCFGGVHMRVKARGSFQGYSEHRTFNRGESVIIRQVLKDRRLWLSVKIDGHFIDVPEHYIVEDKLLYDYNPNELTVHEGDLLEIMEIAFGYAFAHNLSNKEMGWVSLDILESISVV